MTYQGLARFLQASVALTFLGNGILEAIPHSLYSVQLCGLGSTARFSLFLQQLGQASVLLGKPDTEGLD